MRPHSQKYTTMKNKLSEIIGNKYREVAEMKKNRNFRASIMKPSAGDISIIAEIKLASPSAGRLGNEEMGVKQAKEYELGGADAISVVVDKRYFGGSYELLKRIKQTVNLPILAKDFIIDPFQIYEAKIYGADAVLLMVKILNNNRLVKFIKLTAELGMEPVVEVQNALELKVARRTDTRIIAVNARDLTTFKVDIDRACSLLQRIPKKYVSLGFSGVRGRREVEKYKEAGAKAILVGTSLMKTDNIKGFLMSLRES